MKKGTYFISILVTIASILVIASMVGSWKRNSTSISVESGECVIKLGDGGIYHVPLPEGAICENVKMKKVFGNYLMAEGTLESVITNGIDLGRYAQILKADNWRTEYDALGLTASSRSPEGGFLTVASKNNSWIIRISWFGD